MTDTATVETLTAEVRTLMVGKRQVTMSVFNQLDWVDPQHIQPFGRVNAADRRFVMAVGRSGIDGSLVRSRVTNRPQVPTGDGGYLVLAKGEFAPEIYAEWSRLSLIVLAGLR